MKQAIAKLDNEDLYLTISNYSNNGRMYLGLATSEDDLYDSITINLSDTNEIDKDYIYLSNDISGEIKELLRDKGIIGETLMYQQYNMGQYELVKADLNTIREYNSSGVDEFLKVYEEKHQSNSFDDFERN